MFQDIELPALLAAIQGAASVVGHSVPCVVGALWEAEGRFKDTPGGIYSTERMLEKPDDFLSEVMRRGVELFFYEDGLY
jgi:hypothetical protein